MKKPVTSIDGYPISGEMDVMQILSKQSVREEGKQAGSSADMGAYAHLIRTFRGLPASSVHGQVKPREKLLSDVLGRCMDSMGLQQPRIEELIIAHWREIVGSDLAHRCSPREIIRQDTLVITTTNPVLRSELAFRKADILRRLQECLGKGSLIKAVVVR